MKRSELRQIIRETIKEALLTETEELTDTAHADEWCQDNYGGNQGYSQNMYYLRGSWNGEGIACTRRPPGPNQLQLHQYDIQQWMNGQISAPHPTGIVAYEPPTPDFDQSFYNTWQGDYGHHPGHGITPDKTIPGKTSNISRKLKR